MSPLGPRGLFSFRTGSFKQGHLTGWILHSHKKMFYSKRSFIPRAGDIVVVFGVSSVG